MLYVGLVFVVVVALVMLFRGCALIQHAELYDKRARLDGYLLIAGVPWLLVGYYCLWHSK